MSIFIVLALAAFPLLVFGVISCYEHARMADIKAEQKRDRIARDEECKLLKW